MRTILRTLLAALTATLLTLTAAPAYAHDELVSSTPAADATLSKAPTEITLTYSANLMNVEGGNRVRVTDSAGNSLVEGKGDAKVSGNTVTQTLNLKDPAADESYTVTWRVVSPDGHPIQGTYRFTVGAGKTASAPVSSASTEQSSEAQNGSDTEHKEELAPWLWGGGGLLILLVGAIVVMFIRKRNDGPGTSEQPHYLSKRNSWGRPPTSAAHSTHRATAQKEKINHVQESSEARNLYLHRRRRDAAALRLRGWLHQHRRIRFRISLLLGELISLSGGQRCRRTGSQRLVRHPKN